MKQTIPCSQICAAMLAFSLVSHMTHAQPGVAQPKKTTCNCPKNQYTDSTPRRSYIFTNGKTVVLCGYEEPNDQQAGVTFSEFVVAVCGQKTLIGYWDATKTCRVRASRDTLIIEEIETVASSRPALYEPVVWASEKLFFVQGLLQRRRTVNRSLSRRYAPALARQVVQAYETAKGGSDERNIHLAEQLFVATLTGDATARTYFMGFRKKFPLPDGEYAEQYNALRERLIFWDKK